jgi:HSP20 family protein
VDTLEDEGKFTIKADLPGVEKSDVSVTHMNNAVHIRASRPCFEGKKDEYRTWLERPCGQMERVIHLPQGIDDSTMTANIDNGVLTVVANKAETKTKKIDIL